MQRILLEEIINLKAINMLKIEEQFFFQNVYYSDNLYMFALISVLRI